MRTYILDKQEGMTVEDKNHIREMMLLQEKMNEYAISRIISGDWDKYSEEYGSDLCTESDLSREDPFEIRIRSALSRTIYKENKQDNWLKTNLLVIFDKHNNK